jgi:hypothetical protein
VCGRNCLPTFRFILSVSSSRVKNKRSLEKSVREILCSVDRASRYIRVMKTKLMHCLSSVYFVNQPQHVLGIFVAHHQEGYSIFYLMYIRLCSCLTNVFLLLCLIVRLCTYCIFMYLLYIYVFIVYLYIHVCLCIP